MLIVAAPHEPRLRAIVAECAYSSFRDAAKERSLRASARWLHWAVDPFLSAGIAAARLRHGVDLRRASPAAAIRETRVPVLLIHGEGDTETAPENSVRIAAANPAATRLWLVPGAGHTMAWSAAGPEFERRILEFLAAS